MDQIGTGRNSTALSRSWAPFGIYTFVLLAVHSRILGAALELARRDSTASHLLVVPLASLALLIRVAPRCSRVRKHDLWPGLGIVAAGLLVSVSSRVWCDFPACDSGLSLSSAGVVLLWVGGFVALLGLQATRVAAFPLALMAFAIPLPPVVIDALTQFLKQGSAGAVELLFALTGTTFHRDAFIFSFPGLSIEIADECSGIRSSIALMLTGLVASHMFLERWRARALLILLIIPVALIKNAIRIVSLTLLSIYVNPAFLEGQLHHEGGGVFFVLALLMLGPALPLLRRMEASPGGLSARAS